MPPTPRIAFRGPGHPTVVPVRKQLELFRVVNVDRPHHPGLALDFTSNYERGARPRRIERVFAIVHMGISTFTAIEAARAPASASTCRRPAHTGRCGARHDSWRRCVVDLGEGVAEGYPAPQETRS